MIVVGGSAGAVEALRILVEGLPSDLDASVLVVVHIPPSAPGHLVEILQRRSALPVCWARDGQALERGRVYVAPPDAHLVVDDGHIRLTHAPRENHNRPAIDPLFRSAALAHGPRVIGVVLSGRLDDGTAGLWAVKERGGTTVVQDPDDAAHPDMPRNALAYTAADHVTPASALGPLLGRLALEPAPLVDRPTSPELELEVEIAMEADALKHGSLTPSSITQSVERAMWNALRAVEESVVLLREAALRASQVHGDDAGGADRGVHTLDPRFERQTREAEERVKLIRQAVLQHQALSLAAVRSIERTAADDVPVRAD